MTNIFTSGAALVRVSLQVNPYMYLRKNNKPDHFGSEQEYNEQIVAACVANEVKIIAVTDHYSIADSVSLIDQAEAAEIAALPGFEAATSDGVHYLVVFDRGTPVHEIERCIGACGVKAASDEARVGSIDSRELFELAEREWGALVIGAHVTDSKGLLVQLNGQACEEVWRDQRLTAVALSSVLDGIDPGHSDILLGRAVEYRRPHSPAIVYARDVISPADLAKDTGWTSLKLSHLSLDGIRHAFLDPGSRIRLGDGFEPGHAFVSRISWTGGFLDGVSVELNPALNVIVGPRGAGKSTVLESIRFVLDLPVLGDDARSAHEGFVSHVLGSGTKVVASIVDPQHATRWEVERGVGGHLLVRSADGVSRDVDPLDLIGEMEFFGQHEVAELAKMPNARSRLLKRFEPSVVALERNKEVVQGELADNRANLVAARERLARLEEAAERLRVVRGLLESYATAGVKETLDLEAKYEREQPLFDRTAELLDESEQQASRLKALQLDFVSNCDLADLPSRERISGLQVALEQLSGARRMAASEITRYVDGARTLLDEALIARDLEKEAGQEEFLQKLRELNAVNIDGRGYLDLEREQARLEDQTSRLADAKGAIESLEEERCSLLAEWMDLRRREFEVLNVAARRVNQALAGTVRVRCTLEGDRQPLVEFVRDETTGQMHRVTELLGDEGAGFGTIELARACRRGLEGVSELLGLDGQQVAKVADFDEATLMRLEELWLDPTTSIELRVNGNHSDTPVWKPLERLSTGQKATAILLVLLVAADASAPLVIDQAEDDLDNAFIADDIVPRLRREKHRRQFVLSTHNPNIPVLGDAEQVVRISADGEATHGGQATVLPQHSGSLDRASIRDVVEMLEGGKEAFERRRRRYGY